MQSIRLGNTGLKVSRLCLGCMSFGDPKNWRPWVLDETAAQPFYRRAIEAQALSLEAPADMPYGDRRAMVKDAWGNVWQIATHDRLHHFHAGHRCCFSLV